MADIMTTIRGLDYWAKYAGDPAIRVDCAAARDLILRLVAGEADD